MSLASLLGEIIERRSQDGAQIIYEYQYPQPNVRRVASTEPFTKRSRDADMPPVLSPEFMDFCRQVSKVQAKAIAGNGIDGRKHYFLRWSARVICPR
jgi:hypothetical protein